MAGVKVKKTVDILMNALLVLILVGAWATVAVFMDWWAGIEYKIELLRSLLIANTAMAGFASLLLVKIIRGEEDFIQKFGLSASRLENARIFLSWSVIAGCLAIPAIMLYFVSYEISLVAVAWTLFIIELELFIVPLIFARVIVFR